MCCGSETKKTVHLIKLRSPNDLPPEEQEKAGKNLLAYCRLDALAMVKVREELNRAAE